MKLRTGFVSNSSSSSFTIVSTKEVTIDVLREIFGVPEDHPLYDIIDDICKCIMRCAKKVDEDTLRDEIDRWDEDYDKERLKIIESGKILYTGCFGDDDSGSVEAFLCMSRLEYKGADFEFECDGGY